MVRIILILMFGIVSLYAKSSVDACIPIGKIVILKKSIMSLDLSKDQKDLLLKYEETLKDKIANIKDSAYDKKERLSDLFSEKEFLRKKFIEITEKENVVLTNIIAEYLENMYKALNQEQRDKLIKKFKRIEKKGNK
jgi:hypothetical protein